jgi:hypothetical protein
MIDRALIDNFNLKSRDFALRWKNRVRKASQLKHFNGMDDEALIELNRPVYVMLSRVLDRGLDRALMGGFFVKLGKESLHAGFPVSEAIFAINLTQTVVIEYVTTEFAPENPVKMYQALGAISRIAEFFLLGSFYLTKGFLEETYTAMNRHDKVSEELLKKYFKDDFFFKAE